MGCHVLRGLGRLIMCLAFHYDLLGEKPIGGCSSVTALVVVRVLDDCIGPLWVMMSHAGP